TAAPDPLALDNALASAASGAFHWLIFTSPNAARMVGERWHALINSVWAHPVETPPRLPRLAAIGEATARAVEAAFGRAPDRVSHADADALAAAMLPDAFGTRVLLPTSQIARTTLHDHLVEAGAIVTTVTAYATVIGHGGADLPALLAARRIDAITFTSPSTIAYCLRRLDAEGGARADLDRVPIAAIGATTASAARDHGLTVAATAAQPTSAALVAALENVFSQAASPPSDLLLDRAPALALMPSMPALVIPDARPRRLRRTDAIRRLIRETSLQPSDFIYPLFVRHGHDERRPIASMPGQFQFSIDQLASEARAIERLGIPAVLLFGIPAYKDACGTDNFNPDGVIANAIRAIKDAAPDLAVISDLCCCEYTDHGHCGIINTPDHAHYDPNLPHGYLLNDPTLAILTRAAVVHAEAGADMIAPSGMIDGMVGAIRAALNGASLTHTIIMSYACKFASAFYGPFREAAESPPQFGDRKGYQMDPANFREAMKEAALDLEQGADMLMVKPALPYLDVLHALRQRHDVPMAAYHVSGEYAMLHAAAANGWIDLQRCALESLTAIRRAGADMIVTYFAKDAAEWLQGM
ncbi:MAG: porphobilinogen synthase, partial [Chloroflexota bacterium]|nr:porphobilinogen synthase [Chloroflexota bacterium]